MKFRIYYDNGATFEGDSLSDAIDAPSIGVQVIVLEQLENPRGWGIVTREEMYLWKAERFWGCDLPGFYDYLYFHPGIKVVLFGRTICDEQYSAILKRSMQEGLGVR